MNKDKEQSLDDFLRNLTKELTWKYDFEHSYGLGGEYGYGVDFKSDVFEMHPYCWCEKDDCSYCGEEERPNFIYKKGLFTVSWYKYIGRGMEVKGEYNEKIVENCFKSIKKDFIC